MGMFDGFSYETPTAIQQLDNGEYTVRIDSVIPGNYSNGNEYLNVKVSIKGYPGYVPNIITINSRPQLGQLKANGQPVTEDDCKKYDGRLSRFLESFGIQNHDPEQWGQWKNHVGLVKCDWQYDKNEADKKSKQYKQLTPILPKNAEESAKIDAVRAPRTRTASRTPVPQAVQVTKEVMNGDFQEDIPVF